MTLKCRASGLTAPDESWRVVVRLPSSGRAGARILVALGLWRWPLAALGFAYLTVAVVLPFLALLLIALRRNLFFTRLSALANPRQSTVAQFGTVFALLVLSFREFATALLLYTSGTQVFLLAMFDFWERGSTSQVAVMALVQAGLLFVIVLAGQALSGRHDRPVVPGAG